jgi:hypothetical protein
MALMPLKAGQGEGVIKEGKSRRRVMASTRRLQGAEIGGWIQQRHGRAQVT